MALATYGIFPFNLSLRVISSIKNTIERIWNAPGSVIEVRKVTLADFWVPKLSCELLLCSDSYFYKFISHSSTMIGVETTNWCQWISEKKSYKLILSG